MTRLASIILPLVLALAGCQKDPAPASAQSESATDDTSKVAAAADHSQLAETRLHIEGMVCQGCAEGAKSCLTGIEGVVSAEVSIDDRVARVQYDPAKTDPDQMIAALEGLDRGAAPAFHVTLEAPEVQ